MTDEVETWNGPFHRRRIAKGDYGELSKVREEIEEGLDALEQEQLLMFSVELADVVGALNGVAEKYFNKIITDFWESSGFQENIDLLELHVNKQAFIEKALESCQMIFELTSKEASEKRIKRMLGNVVILATYFNLSFEDLNHFAILRSRVARYAVENS